MFLDRSLGRSLRQKGLGKKGGVIRGGEAGLVWQWLPQNAVSQGAPSKGGGDHRGRDGPVNCPIQRLVLGQLGRSRLLWDMKLIIWNTLFKKHSTELSIKAKLFYSEKRSHNLRILKLKKPQTSQNSDKSHSSFLCLPQFYTFPYIFGCLL